MVEMAMVMMKIMMTMMMVMMMIMGEIRAVRDLVWHKEPAAGREGREIAEATFTQATKQANPLGDANHQTRHKQIPDKNSGGKTETFLQLFLGYDLQNSSLKSPMIPVV